MRKLVIGVVLVALLFGHNFVLNQPQSMQEQIEKIYKINVTQFNLLYSIPSAVSLLLIVMMVFWYEKCSHIFLICAIILLSVGQLMVAVFGADGRPYFYSLLVGGRVFEGVGAEILYVVQGNLASSWMGKMAGVVFILPEFGEIFNVFLTPWLYLKWGVAFTFFVGFLTCFLSTLAGAYLYYYLRKFRKQSNVEDQGTFAIQLKSNNKLKDEEGDIIKEQENPLIEAQVYEVVIQKKTIFQAGTLFWLMILLCATNQCLFFPFLDNGTELITKRFCIPYESTGYYLSLPFIAAMISSCVSGWLLLKFSRKVLILLVSFIPLLAHGIIFLNQDCEKDIPTLWGQITLAVGFSIFGIGIGTYYSISFPAVGLAVPQNIRGSAYACLGSFQTIAMTIVPIISGIIIEEETLITKLSQGYKRSSLLFVIICFVGVTVSGAVFCVAKQNSFAQKKQQQIQKQQKQLN